MAKRGETRDVIINAATKVFFTNGFEKTSVKMILDEAHVVTGSFYHFFPSKEALFETVVQRFVEGHAQKIGDVLGDDTLCIQQIIMRILEQLSRSSETYYQVLQCDRLPGSVQLALHDMMLEAMVAPLAKALTRLKASGAIKSLLDVEDVVMARIMLKGSEAIIYGGTEVGMERFQSEKVRNNLVEFWKRILEFS